MHAVCSQGGEEGDRREVALPLGHLLFDRNGIERMERPLGRRPTVP